MTREEYAMLRSIAAADGTEGPNFDPALLSELLDVYDAATATFTEWSAGFLPERLIGAMHDLRRALGR